MGPVRARRDGFRRSWTRREPQMRRSGASRGRSQRSAPQRPRAQAVARRQRACAGSAKRTSAVRGRLYGHLPSRRKVALSRKLRPCVTEFRQRGGALHRVVFNGSRTLTNDLTPACARPRPQHSRVRKNIGDGTRLVVLPRRVGQSAPRGVVSREAKMPVGRLEVNVMDAVRLRDTQTWGKQTHTCGCGAALATRIEQRSTRMEASARDGWSASRSASTGPRPRSTSRCGTATR